MIRSDSDLVNDDRGLQHAPGTPSETERPTFRMPFVGGAVYAMSKAALVGLVKGLARDLGPRGITVNNVQPGPIDTDMNPANSEFAAMLRNQVMALPRYGTVDEIAGMVAYLAGPEAGFVTGASLTIDGGFTA